MDGVINEIELRGVVSACAEGKVWVVPSAWCSEQAGCNGGCGSCGGKKPRRRIMVETALNDRFAPGASVTLRSFQLNEAIGALIVFGIPLLSALTVFLVWYAIDPSTVESGGALLVAGSAFFCGFIIVRIIDRIFRKRFPSKIVPAEVLPVFSAPPEGIKGHG
ncbi:MAG: SoxR reducing system RseC family protein [Chitinispirillaceae bacterium]|nr:SoxR reducing system RseC family protein [Chitinispirillaceae bacterium]